MASAVSEQVVERFESYIQKGLKYILGLTCKNYMRVRNKLLAFVHQRDYIENNISRTITVPEVETIIKNITGIKGSEFEFLQVGLGEIRNKSKQIQSDTEQSGIDVSNSAKIHEEHKLKNKHKILGALALRVLQVYLFEHEDANIQTDKMKHTLHIDFDETQFPANDRKGKHQLWILLNLLDRRVNGTDGTLKDIDGRQVTKRTLISLGKYGGYFLEWERTDSPPGATTNTGGGSGSGAVVRSAGDDASQQDLASDLARNLANEDQYRIQTSHDGSQPDSLPGSERPDDSTETSAESGSSPPGSNASGSGSPLSTDDGKGDGSSSEASEEKTPDVRGVGQHYNLLDGFGFNVSHQIQNQYNDTTDIITVLNAISGQGDLAGLNPTIPLNRRTEISHKVTRIRNLMSSNTKAQEIIKIELRDCEHKIARYRRELLGFARNMVKDASIMSIFQERVQLRVTQSQKKQVIAEIETARRWFQEFGEQPPDIMRSLETMQRQAEQWETHEEQVS